MPKLNEKIGPIQRFELLINVLSNELSRRGLLENYQSLVENEAVDFGLPGFPENLNDKELWAVMQIERATYITTIAAKLSSARDLKENFQQAEEVLGKVVSLPVERWNYIGDPQERIGPMAEDFSERFGGSERSIDVVSYLGVIIKAIQELDAKFEEINEREFKAAA